MKELKNYFEGNYQNISSGETHETFSPVNLEQKLWSTQFDTTHVEAVIISAKKGFDTLRKMSLQERCNLLMKYKDEVLKSKEEIAHALSLEVGKPYWEALTEAGALAAKVDVTINESLKRIENTTIENVIPNLNGHTIHKPLGPSLVIGPFNFPCHLANGQILSLILSGNSIIFKPSEKTLISTSLMIDCFHRAGFPAGVINFIIGGGKIAQDIINHKSIKGIFFTGSKGVGLKILESTYSKLDKLVALELGGKNSTILAHDASLDHAIPELINSCFLTTGQRCTSTGNILVHRSLAKEFSDKFKEVSKRIIVDHPTDFSKKPFMSSLIDQAALDKFQAYTKNLEAQNIEAILPFKLAETNFKGHYVCPSLHHITHADLSKHSFIGEEVFAPHATIIEFDEIEEAIEIANSTEFGLAGALFTQDSSLYNKCLHELNVGIFNLNRSTVGASSKLPFGGVKSSGNHRPAAVTMIDACVHKVASLETYTTDSTLEKINGLQ